MDSDYTLFLYAIQFEDMWRNWSLSSNHRPYMKWTRKSFVYAQTTATHRSEVSRDERLDPPNVNKPLPRMDFTTKYGLSRIKLLFDCVYCDNFWMQKPRWYYGRVLMKNR